MQPLADTARDAQISASTDRGPGVEGEQIPLEVLREHNGKWIAWDEETRSVLGVGDTFEAAERQAKQKKPLHLLRFHHANWMSEIPTRAEQP